MILERVENAQREAGPHRQTEIERHPGNLVLPLGKVVRHDPARAHVAQTLERFQKKLAAINYGDSALNWRDDDPGDNTGEAECSRRDDVLSALSP